MAEAYRNIKLHTFVGIFLLLLFSARFVLFLNKTTLQCHQGQKILVTKYIIWDKGPSKENE